jgi:hypothetical protein
LFNASCADYCACTSAVCPGAPAWAAPPRLSSVEFRYPKRSIKCPWLPA